MFSSRNNDRKLDRRLIKKFQANFSGILIPTSGSEGLNRAVNPKELYRNTASEAIPELRFTHFLDDQSLPDSTGDQSYNKRVGIFNTGLHGLAGDLHTPTLQSELLTPGTLLEQFTGAVTPLHRNNVTKYADPFNPQYLVPTAQDISWKNSTSPYQSSRFVQLEGVHSVLHVSSEEIPVKKSAHGGQTVPEPVKFEESLSGVAKAKVDDHVNFRYQVSLNTPTAMIHNANEIPITYLNKGHTYSLSIIDSKPFSEQTGLIQYRTSIRISFDATEHASNPTSCWSLWKANSTHHAKHQNHNFHAVELVHLGRNQGGTHNFHVERASLDGFSIRWFTDASGRSVCNLGIRFNLLSTDFSYSKGVKGSPLRLCAKTEAINQDIAELCYCKVKVFRDHGAERKMFTDVSQLKRAIERRKVKYLKEHSGGDNLGKRKRDSAVIGTRSEDPGDERTAHLQNGLDAELAEMQKAFSSNRHVSKFCIPGDSKDDPDLFPIQLLDEGTPVLHHKPQPALNTLTPPFALASGSRNISQSPANYRPPKSTGEITTRRTSLVEAPSPTGGNVPFEHAVTERNGSAERLVFTEGEGVDGELKSGDKSTCFYVRFQDGEGRPDNYHTALFLKERTAQNLRTKISQKQNFSQDLEIELFQVKANGLEIRIDDDVVRQIPNNQAMTAEISRPLASDDSAEGEAVSGTIVVKISF